MQTRDGLARRLKSLIAYRVAFVTVLLGSFLFFEISPGVVHYGNSVFILIVALYAVSIVYLLLLNRIKPVLFAYVQSVMDVLAAIALIYITGGIESWFSSILILAVISSVIVGGRKVGYTAGVLASILYGVLIDLQYYGLLGLKYSGNFEERHFLYNIFAHILAIYLSAYLTGYLLKSLERTTRKYERKLLEHRDLSLFNREVLENVPSGLITTDTEGNVLLFNKAAQEITGIDVLYAVGMNAGDIFPFLGEIPEAVKRAEGVITREGEKRTLGMTISGMRNSSGEHIGYIGIFSDLTDIKNMQAEIEKKKRWAAIGELSASIAHEIRNPLASLRGSVEMLLDAKVAPEQKEFLIGVALSEMDRLNRIVTDFLSYSRPTSPELEEVALHELLGNISSLIEKSAPEGVRVERELQAEISVQADPRRLQQVFHNLASNAFEAMPGGGTLGISCRRNGRFALVSFSDSGPGIPEAEKEKIFYPFFTTKDSGTGLGLSIAMRIIEDHGGTIRVESTPGRGTAFRVYLPLGGKK